MNLYCRRFLDRNALLCVLVLLGLVTASLSALAGCKDADPNPQRDAALNEDSGDAAHAGHAHGSEGVEHIDEVTLLPDAIERYGIKIEQASLWKLRPTFPAPARVAFNAEALAHVGTPLPGRVQELHVRLGDIVNKGDVLLIVESPELGEAQSEYLQKRILANSSGAAVELAKNTFERASQLHEKNQGIALDEVQKREVEYKVADASLRAAQSAVLASENKLHLHGMHQSAVEQLIESGEVNPRFNIVAPLSGRVVEREITLGERVSPEQEALIVLADTTTLWVLADVPEARLPEVALGAPAWLKSSGSNGHKHEGEVSYISPMVDPRTQSAEVRIAVKCEHGTLWPGMFVQVEITATDQNNPDPPPVVAVAEEAVQTVEGLSSIFVPVLNEPNTFARRKVSVGKPVAGFVPIYSGLVEGEPFVAAGSFILKADLGKAGAEHQH